MPIKGLKGGIGSKALGYGLGAADAEATDAEFNQTVLLLHGDGSEGAGDTAALGDPNYKAFKDNSTSAHAITVNGDAYGNDFSPYYYADGYWSASLDGGDNRITIVDDTTLDLGSNDFTIEAWVYMNSYDSSGFTSFIYKGGLTTASYHLDYKNGTTELRFLMYVSGTANTNLVGTTTLSLNTWYHIAAVRNGTSWALYKDGTSVATYTSSLTVDNTTDAIGIGRRPALNDRRLNGYISNVRIVNGTSGAVYTSNFTPSTSPLTAVTDTALLTCQSNRFIDNSSNGHDVTTPTGTPKISTNTPFTVTKTANVGSGFFDGDNDGLSIPESTDTRLSANDFTFECWYYGQSNTSANKNLFNQSTSGVYAPMNVYQYGNGVRVAMSSNGTSYNVLNDTTTYGTNGYVNQWNHVAVSRNGSNFAIFLNGTRVHNFTSSDTLMTPTQPTTIGVRPSNTDDYTGYISDSRLVIGSTIYDPTSTTITPPTTSLTAVTNTKLLTCQYSGAVRNVGFLDDSKYNHQITRGGDVNMGTFSPFSLEDGYWSVYSDNADLSWGDINDTDFQFGTGDFTWELFVYLNATGQDHYFIGSLKSSPEVGFGFYYRNSSTAIRLYSSTAGTFDYSWTPSAGQWYHIALVRNSNSLACYVDGTEIGTAQSITGNVNPAPSAEKLEAPGNGYLSSSQDFYISNTRMCKTAVYTGNFTVPTSPLTTTSQGASNCVLLCNQSNRFLDNSSSGHASEIDTGTPKVQPFSPFAPSRSYSKDAVGGSAYFDGSGDGLNAGTSAVFLPVANADFTFEAWVYLTATPGAQGAQIMGVQEYGTNSDWIFYVGSDLVTDLWIQAASSGAGVTYAGSTAIKLNEWNHIAWSRSGTGSNNMKLFINGVQDAQYTYTGTMKYNGSTGLTLGSDGAFDEALLTGYMSNPRIINGTGLYTSAFTPPTAPFLDSNSNYDNTTFLARFDNAGIIDHTMKNNLETEGNVRISGQQTKFGTGSIYFDGSGDKLVIPETNEFLSLGINGEPFTIEVWAYPTNTMSGSGQIISKGGGTASWSATSGAQYQWTINSSAVTWNFNSGGSSVSVGGGTVTLNTWQHLAVSYDGTTTRTYLNGTQQNTNTNTYTAPTTRNIQYIGMTQSSGYTQAYYGFLDEFRITKGVCRYPDGTTFTPLTQAFANK